MRYFIGVLIPFFLQSLLVFVVIEMNTGNGSWVGLGALILGMFAIPMTCLANFFYIRARKDIGSFSAVAPCFVIALIVPVIILFLLILG